MFVFQVCDQMFHNSENSWARKLRYRVLISLMFSFQRVGLQLKQPAGWTNVKLKKRCYISEFQRDYRATTSVAGLQPSTHSLPQEKCSKVPVYCSLEDKFSLQ